MSFFKQLLKSIMGYKEIEFKVAGVSFKNGRRTRQAILRAIKYKDEPYNGPVKITFKKVDFEGKDAIEVWTNDELIGYVPKDKSSDFLNYWKSDYAIEEFKILGPGESNIYGCRIKVLFNK